MHPQTGYRAAGPADYALLVTLAAVWGGSFLLIKIGVETIAPLTLTAARLSIAAVFLLAATRLAGQRMPWDPRVWVWIVLAAVFGNALPFTLITWGEERIDSGLAAILMAVMPLTTVLLAHLLTGDEKLTVRKATGVSFGVVGLIVLIGPDKLLALGADAVRQLAVAGAAASYGINALITKRLAGMPRRAMAAAIMTVSTAMLVPAAALVERPWDSTPSLASLSAVIVLGVLQTAVATLMMFALITRQGASFFAQINFMVPLFGVFWGAAVLAERPPPQAWAALAIILAGIAIARPAAQSPAGQARDQRPERTNSEM